jgi:hypothetical protein
MPAATGNRRRDVKRVLVAGVAIWSVLTCTIQLAAQSGALAARFEVASIRPSQPGERYQLIFLPDGGMSARSSTVERLIVTAYELQRGQLANKPNGSTRKHSTSKRDLQLEWEAQDRTCSFGFELC